jgi:hypothetical protein
MNWCLATQFLTEVGTAVLVKKAKNILRYLTDLQQRPVVVDYQSSKNPRSLAACISRKWEDHNFMGRTETLLTATGYLVVITSGANPAGVASVEPEGAGTRMSYTDNGTVFMADVRKEVEVCK